MTPKERAAMQQALEALEEAKKALVNGCKWIETPLGDDEWRVGRGAWEVSDKAITALREALGNSLKPKCFADYQPNHAIDRVCASCPVAAECQTGKQQAEQRSDSERMEPVARVTGYYGGRCVIEPLNRATVLPTDMALYAAPQPVSQEPVAWIEGYPKDFYSEEWFIAITIYGDRVVLKALPENYSYDFTTADGTYMKKENVKRWMQFPDSEFLPPTVAALVAAHEKKFWMEQIEVECNEAVLAEREACAKLCYGCNKDLEEANAKYVEQAEQSSVAATPTTLAEPVALLQLAEDALVYHTEQTRPIQNTIDVLAAIQKFKEKQR